MKPPRNGELDSVAVRPVVSRLSSTVRRAEEGRVGHTGTLRPWTLPHSAEPLLPTDTAPWPAGLETSRAPVGVAALTVSLPVAARGGESGGGVEVAGARDVEGVAAGAAVDAEAGHAAGGAARRVPGDGGRGQPGDRAQEAAEERGIGQRGRAAGGVAAVIDGE